MGAAPFFTAWLFLIRYYRHEDTQGILQNAVSIANDTKLDGYIVSSIPTENTWITTTSSANLNSDTVYLNILDNSSSNNEIIVNISLCFVNCISSEHPYHDIHSTTALCPSVF